MVGRGDDRRCDTVKRILASWRATSEWLATLGRRGSGIVYPGGAMACSLSNAVFSSVIGFAYDLTGGYAVMLVAFVAFLACADALVLWGYRKRGVAA